MDKRSAIDAPKGKTDAGFIAIAYKCKMQFSILIQFKETYL
jgi:hypothetical protein